MTKKQVEWAKQHDWFIQGCMDLEGKLGVIVRNDNPAQDEPFRFYDFKELKAWAGY